MQDWNASHKEFKDAQDVACDLMEEYEQSKDSRPSADTVDTCARLAAEIRSVLEKMYSCLGVMRKISLHSTNPEEQTRNRRALTMLEVQYNTLVCHRDGLLKDHKTRTRSPREVPQTLVVPPMDSDDDLECGEGSPLMGGRPRDMAALKQKVSAASDVVRDLANLVITQGEAISQAERDTSYSLVDTIDGKNAVSAAQQLYVQNRIRGTLFSVVCVAAVMVLIYVFLY